MNETVQIQYRGFYDRPLSFVVEHRGRQLLFWIDFNEVIEEYENEYQIFTLPHLTFEDLATLTSWEDLPQRATERLGRVPVQDVQFDETRRKEVNVKVIDMLLSR